MNCRKCRLILVVQALIVGAGMLFPSSSSPQGPPALDGPKAGAIARIYVQDTHDLNAVAGELDIWETHLQDGYVVAAITSEQRQWLERLGYRVEVDAETTATLGTQAVLDPRFYYFDDQYPNPNDRYIVDLLQEVNAVYPDLTELIDIGDAWLASQPGEPDRDIWVLRITNEDPAYGPILDKPAFFLFATMHAREVAAAELAIRYLKYVTGGYDGEGGYGLDADVTWLVDHHVAYVLVVQNPDGHVENERDWYNYRRKNMDWDDGCSDPDSWGVDLNRNHSFLWGCCGGSSSSSCSETYRGPSRGSEPETQAFEGYFATVMRDQNGPNGDDEIAPASPITTTGIFISLHSYGDLVLWPWGFDDHGSAPNHAELRTIGRKFAVRTRFGDYDGHDPAGFLYPVDGATDDWTYGKFGIASFTFEVGPSLWDDQSCGGFYPSYGCIDGNGRRHFWAENKPAFLYAHKIARTPYVTAYGPDVGSTTFIGAGLPGGGPARLTVSITDHRCCGDTPQPIAGAEYFLDIPGPDGTGMPMSPVDGDWGDLSEEALALVDISELDLEQQYILVHGQNDDGRWGPFSAVFLAVDYRTYLPFVIRR